MQIFGMFLVLCLWISYVIDVSDAECDEIFVVLEEHICSDGTGYRITPLKKEKINWDDVTFPCDSTVEDFEKKKCLGEFDYNSTNLFCEPHIKVVNNQSHYFIAGNHSAKLTAITTESPDVTTNKMTVATEEPEHKLDEEMTASMCDVNLIYINENNIRNSSETSSKTTQNETLICDHAETVCFDELKPENKNLSDVKNVTHIASTLLISIDRDASSSVQPIFTGYFPKSSNDSSTNYDGNFKYLKTMSTLCSIPKYNNCKEKMQINIYFKVNYIENNTITKYPNCTQETIGSTKILNVKCEDVLFAKHNQNITQTLTTVPPRQEMLICQIKEKDQSSEINNLHFINCSKSGNETIVTKAPLGINKDNSSHGDPKNMIIIFIPESANNCSQKIPLNIDEGKIIDLGINKKEEISPSNNIELMLSNCVNYNSSTINDKQPPSNAELNIILKSKSLNASNLEQFNGSPQAKNVQNRILLHCNHHNNDSSSNATSSKTTLQCESIDLDFYNITGIYITPSSQTSNVITSENKIKQKLLTWNCQILESTDTSKESYKRSIYFKNCSNEIHINNNKSNSGDIMDEFNKTKTPSGKFDPNKPLKPKNMIKIHITEIPNNCSHHSHFIIGEGKIIDFGVNTNQEKIQQNNIVDLKLSSCVDFNSSIINETHPNLNVDLTIIMKNESLNAETLQLFNGTGKNESDKQRVLLRCEYSNVDSSSNATTNKTSIHCEYIDLDSINITGIEIGTIESQSTITNINKELEKDNVETNKTVDTNNKSHENNTTVVENISGTNSNNKKKIENLKIPNTISETKEISIYENFNRKADIPDGSNHENNTTLVENISGTNSNNKKKIENIKIPKTVSEKKEISIYENFNRKADIPDGSGQSSQGLGLSLGLGLGSPTTETTFLVTLLAAIATAILMALVWGLWPRKKYVAAPTREPRDDEETAF